MLNRRQFSVGLAGSASLVFASTARSADKFPSKPIKIIFPGAPGSGVEAVIRSIAEKVSVRLGQPVIIENRPGGNSQIGVAYVAKSPPDGYTLGVGFVTNLSLAQHTFKEVPYNPLKDLAPVALLATNYLALVARPDAPFSNVSEMSRWAKAAPNGLNVGSTSIGGLPHLAFEQLVRSAAIPFTVVSYNSSPGLLQDLIGSRLDVGMLDFSSARQMADSGKLRLLGITNPARDPRYPQVPALSESVKGYEALGWFGLVAAAGTPQPVVDTLNEAVVAAIPLPDVQAAMATFALVPAGGSPQVFAAWLQSEDQKFAALVKQIGFKPQ